MAEVKTIDDVVAIVKQRLAQHGDLPKVLAPIMPRSESEPILSEPIDSPWQSERTEEAVDSVLTGVNDLGECHMGESQIEEPGMRYVRQGNILITVMWGNGQLRLGCWCVVPKGQFGITTIF